LISRVPTPQSLFDLFLVRYLRPFFSFFFNDPATTEIYTLSLHDALPIYFFSHYSRKLVDKDSHKPGYHHSVDPLPVVGGRVRSRSEEHTSELQSRSDLVCRLLLEKKSR